LENEDLVGTIRYSHQIKGRGRKEAWKEEGNQKTFCLWKG